MTPRPFADIEPDPLLGQNFLVDEALIRREVDLLALTDADSVLEIGPGPGTVTERILAARASVSMSVIEKDRRFEARLGVLAASHPGLTVVWGDALEAELPPFTKAVSNLPFRIALPLIFRMLERDFDRAVLICQKRLADRMCAARGEDHYCRVSVQIQRLADARVVCAVPPRAFHPRPAVDCALVLLEKRVKFAVPDEEYFKRVLDYLFFRRGESCRDAVSGLVGGRDRFPRELQASAEKAVESLTIPEFGAIARALHTRGLQIPVIPNEMKRKVQKLRKRETDGAAPRRRRSRRP